jgi:hypothetical protein
VTADLAGLHHSVVRAVTASSSAPEAWNAVVRAIAPSGHRVPDALLGWDVATEVDQIAAQLSYVRDQAPPPTDVSFLYFGLVDLADPNGNWQEVGPEIGFYVSGGQADDPERDLPEAPRSYFPEDRFLESSLLREIRDASKALGRDYNVFDYGLMLGAAGLLAKFAAQRLDFRQAILVGFDCGDFARFA